MIPQIKHIVVLMMENHSYDNYLGMLTGRGEGLPLAPDGSPQAASTLPNGQVVPAHHFSLTVQAKENPTQSWHASHIQYGNGTNDGFARSTAECLPDADPSVPIFRDAATGNLPAVPTMLAKLENTDDGPTAYDRLGFRVPAVIVSPYARPDFTLSEVFDHTSMLKLIEEKWNLPPLTRRDEAAISPLGALDFQAPPAFLKRPDLPATKAGPFRPVRS